LVISGRKQLVPTRSVSVHQVLGDNIQYLEFYHRCTVPAISGKFDQEFWSKTVLQMAQSELAIRHALIALSYLTKSESGTLKDARSTLVATSKQQTVLTHYNKAIKHLVQRATQPSYSTEVGLVCCLVFICLETLRGNYETALAHFKSGLDIINTYNNRSVSGPVQAVRPKVFEDILIPMFTRNIATAIVFGLPSESVSYNSAHYPIGTQKCVFNTVMDADLAAHNIRNMAFVLTRLLGTKVVTQEKHTKEELQAQEDCLEHHRVWLRALETLEGKAKMSKEHSVAAAMLKVLHYLMYIFTTCVLLDSQKDFDKHVNDFKAVIKHARTYLEAAESAPLRTAAAHFTFTIGIIPALYLTACRCRCPFTRREALALLERDLPREGLWDAQQHAIVARRVIELEEREVDPDTGWPVERTRIWSTMIHGEMDGKGRFPVYFAIGHWGEGRGTPPLPPGGILPHDPRGRIWREWFVLP
jgi:hypothetical protein